MIGHSRLMLWISVPQPVSDSSPLVKGAAAAAYRSTVELATPKEKKTRTYHPL